jgi:hypothetical protein
MKVLSFLVLTTWLCAGAGFAGAPGQEGMDRAVSLPSAVAGWTWDGKEPRYDPRTLFDYIDGAGEMFLAYGFQHLTLRRFEKPTQPPLILEVYDMGSSEDAYGVFSFERQESGGGIGQGSELGGGLLRFWKGRYFVSIFADGEGAETETAILELGRHTASAIPGTGPEPRVVSLIPGKDAGLVETSVRFLRSHILLNQHLFIAHENILNLSRKTDAVLAQYGREKQKTQLLLVRYPSAPEAGEAHQRFLAAYLPDAVGKDRRNTEDQRWTIARRWNEFVLVVFGAPTEREGEALFQATEGALRSVR